MRMCICVCIKGEKKAVRELLAEVYLFISITSQGQCLKQQTVLNLNIINKQQSQVLVQC